MPRPPRIEFENAVYHLVNRSNRGEPVFKDDADRTRFLETLGIACAKTGWKVFAYSLMPDHFHLVLQTPQSNLVTGMKWFLGTYTIQFNRRHKSYGHLFRGRYKSLLIDPETPPFLAETCVYVLLNPSRANLITPRQPLTNYPWTSLQTMLVLPNERPAWLLTSPIFAQLGLTDDTSGRARFLEILEQRRQRQEDWHQIRRGWCFGSESFRQKLLATVSQPNNQTRLPRKEIAIASAERIIEEELQKRAWTEADLGQRRKGDPEKVAIARRVRQETTVSLKWLAARLQMGVWTHLANCLYRSDVSSPTKPAGTTATRQTKKSNAPLPKPKEKQSTQPDPRPPEGPDELPVHCL